MGRGRRGEERGEEGLVATSSSLFREKGRREEKSILFLPLGQNGMKKRSLGRTDPPSQLTPSLSVLLL